MFRLESMDGKLHPYQIASNGELIPLSGEVTKFSAGRNHRVEKDKMTKKKKMVFECDMIVLDGKELNG